MGFSCKISIERWPQLPRSSSERIHRLRKKPLFCFFFLWCKELPSWNSKVAIIYCIYIYYIYIYIYIYVHHCFTCIYIYIYNVESVWFCFILDHMYKLLSLYIYIFLYIAIYRHVPTLHPRLEGLKWMKISHFIDNLTRHGRASQHWFSLCPICEVIQVASLSIMHI